MAGWKGTLNTVLAFGVGSALALGASALAAAEKITWRLQTVAGAGTSEYKYLIEAFAKRVDQLTEGRVEIKVFPAGMLMSSAQVPDAVSKGALEMGQTYLVYFAGREPALQSVNEWPATVHPMQAPMWFYDHGGAELMRKVTARHGIYFLGISPILGEHIWSKKPLKGIEDLKGLKIRASALAADSFAKLGASPVSLSGEEVYPALQRGIVDAAEFTTLPVNYGFGFHEITKYVILPTYSGGGSSDWIVNLNAWNALPDDLKPKLDQAVRLASYDFWRQTNNEEARLVKTLADKGVEFITWSAEDMKALEAARFAVMREKYAAASEDFKAQLESRIEMLEGMGYQIPTID